MKKSKYSFSYHLQTDKKIDNVSKNNPKRKADSKFEFFPSCLGTEALIRMIKVVHISFYTRRG